MPSDCPVEIGGARVLWFTRVDPPLPRSPIKGFAIVRSGSACLLFGCDHEWQSLYDTWHPTAELAKAQAAAHHAGATMKWIAASAEKVTAG